METDLKPQPDSQQIDEARRYLRVLSDTPDENFTFQTFDDSGEKRTSFARTFHGSLEQHWDELCRLNQQGAGVFATVNQTDGTGRRKKDNIVALRALFADSDNGDLPALVLQPSAVVQSKNGQHGYFALMPGEELAAFTSAQKALSHHLGTDPSVNDLPRVMRLPGFFHMKNPNDPFLVKVVSTHPTRYTIAEVLSHYPAALKPERKKAPASNSAIVVDNICTDWVNQYPIEEGSANRYGGRDNTLLRLIREGLGRGILPADLEKYVLDYCRRSGFDESVGLDMLKRQIAQHADTPFQSYILDISPFKIADGKLYYVEKDDGGDDEPDETLLATAFEVLADTRDEHNNNWGRLVRFNDRDGIVHQFPIPCEMLVGDGAECIKLLIGKGAQLHLESSARKRLIQYIHTAPTGRKQRCVGQVGWVGENYVLPDEYFGPGLGGEEVVLQVFGDVHKNITANGTLDEWKENVAAPCSGNSRLVFAVSVAFSGPLLHPLNGESGGFHIRGGSSTGKTTALLVAGSVYGGGGNNGYLQNWRATVNGMESVAKSHNDGILILDELAQINPKEAGETAYMLANGKGKNRSSKDGHLKKSAEWRVAILSSGEISLAEHMMTAGQQIRAGQETRMVDISADAGTGTGVFDKAVGAPEDFARKLSDQSRRYYGTAIREFVKRLVEGQAQAKAFVQLSKKEFLDKVEKAPNAGQLMRVAERFALVAAAGELAISYAILPWKQGEALWAAEACMAAWLAHRGTGGDLEARNALAQIKAFLQANPGRFTPLSSSEDRRSAEDHMDIKRVGYCKHAPDGKSIFYVFPEAFKNELCKGFSSELVKRTLIEKDYLILGTDGKPYTTTRAGGLPQKFYAIKGSILEDLS